MIVILLLINADLAQLAALQLTSVRQDKIDLFWVLGAILEAGIEQHRRISALAWLRSPSYILRDSRKSEKLSELANKLVIQLVPDVNYITGTSR